jgi:phosphonate transport system ATP-binding protein
VIRFESISQTHTCGTQALKHISLTIPKGQVCILLGPSGAGKSSLLRCVNGLNVPTTGKVFVDDVEITPRSLKTIRPTIGMIHQAFNLTTRATVAVNVIAGALPVVSTLPALLNLFPHEHQARVCELMDLVGLSEAHLTRRVSELSGGQQQRVGIARAFMLDPAIILADEPVASLDPAVSEDILALLVREARARGATVFCSLHQLNLARQFADRIVALKAGELVFDGPPADLTSDAATRIYQTPVIPALQTEPA